MQLRSILHLQLEDVLEIEGLLLAAAAVGARARRAVGVDDSLLHLLEIARDVRIVLLERLRKGVMAVTLGDVEQVVAAGRSEGRIERRLAGTGDGGRGKSG